MTTRGAPWDTETNPVSLYFNPQNLVAFRGTDVIRTSVGVSHKLSSAPAGTQYGISNQPNSLFDVVLLIDMVDGQKTIHIPPSRGLDLAVSDAGFWNIVLGSVSGGVNGVLIATSGVWDGNEVAPAGGAVSAFTSLTDTPPALAGSAGQVAITNPGETALVFGPLSYDVAIGFRGTPEDAEVMARVTLPRAVNFAADFAGSGGTIETNPTGSMDIDVQDDGATIGTITIATDGGYTFVTVGNTAKVLATGSVLSFVGPGTADASAADIFITLLGTL